MRGFSFPSVHSVSIWLYKMSYCICPHYWFCSSSLWVPTRKIKNQIESSKISCLITTHGCTNRLRYEDIGNEPQIFCINGTTQRYSWNGSQRLDRMEDRRLLKVAYRFRPFEASDVGDLWSLKWEFTFSMKWRTRSINCIVLHYCFSSSLLKHLMNFGNNFNMAFCFYKHF